MGNNSCNYYNKINKKGWFLSKQTEIKNMEKMFRKHLNDYIVHSKFNPNEEIKIILYLDDFYDLLASPMYKGYMQIYERKLYGYSNSEASDEFIKSNREVPQNLYEIINSELINILEMCAFLELLIKTNYVVAKKLTKKIQKVMSSLDNLEGENLVMVSKQLAQMINTKRNLVSQLTENGLIILSNADMHCELSRINYIVMKCNIILQRTRHSISTTKIDHIEPTVVEVVEVIDVNNIVYIASAPPFVDLINIEKE